MSAMKNILSRRQFLRYTTLAAGATTLSFPYVGRVLGANGKIGVACIGVGGKGDSDSSSAAGNGGNIVAICDVDANTLERKAKQFPNAKKYKDFRKMLTEVEKDIDAVTVSTPDHCHGVASIMAMNMGKHIYCQKPLTQTVWEAREMRRLAKEKKLATQMGNQGSGSSGLRRAVEVVQAGVLGPVRELFVWSNRPIWPQGLNRPAGEDPVPENLDWDLWLGPAALRPFKKDVYHPFKWRGWYDFGTGALGDMACHTVNMPFRALKLGFPSVVECEKTSGMFPETFPKSSRIRFEFPEREGLPPLKFWWSDGGWKPEAEYTKEIRDMMGNVPGSGCLIIGEKGKLFSPDDYGEKFYIMVGDQKEFKGATRKEKQGEKTVEVENDAIKDIPKTIVRSPGHDQEWFRMMKDLEGKPAYSNFDIAAYLTEIILLGCIALRVGEGRKMEWDGPNMKSPNIPEAAKFVKRQNRQGWES
jgi:predicted dehydrogenase